MKKLCKHCIFWQNQQRELDYKKNVGFCRCYDDDEGESPISCFIHNAIEKVESAMLNNDGTVKSYRCELVTRKNFGCRFFQKSA
jgi:hypothetical protein